MGSSSLNGLTCWGSFGNGDIRAWTAASDTGYTIESLPFRPRFSLKAEYLVFPQPRPLPAGWSSGEPKETGNISRLQKGSSGETESIDHYTEKEPLKQIHWKLSARHEELLVKEMSKESGKPVIIEPEQLPGTVEERLGHAAFLINSLMLEGRAVGLRIGEKNILPGISRGHRLKMLGELACHAPD